MPNKEINILLVEDDDIDAMLVKSSLEKNKIANKIIRAVDGVEALEKLRAGQVSNPYLILLDLNMPRMGGLEFLETIRADKDLKTAIIFVFTTSQAEQDKWRAYEHNIAGYLLKDSVGKHFVEAVKLIDCYWRIVEFP